MKLGYARVSTDAQDLTRQRDQLTEAGAQRIFEDTITGAKTGEGLNELLSHVREGDEVIVCEISRLGRSLSSLIETVSHIRAEGSTIRSLKEGWIRTDDAMGKMFFYLLGMFAEMERDYIRERTIRGLASARARGRVGGRPRLPARQTQKAVELYKEGRLTVPEIIKVTGVSKATLYRYIRESASHPGT